MHEKDGMEKIKEEAKKKWKLIKDNKKGNKINAEDLVGDLCYEFVNINPYFDAYRFREATKSEVIKK